MVDRWKDRSADTLVREPLANDQVYRCTVHARASNSQWDWIEGNVAFEWHVDA